MAGVKGLKSVDEHIYDVSQAFQHYRATKHRGDVLDVLSHITRLPLDPNLKPKERLRQERLIFNQTCDMLEIERCLYREVVKLVSSCCLKTGEMIFGCLLSQ